MIGRTVNPHPAPTLHMTGKAAMCTLPRPCVIQAPDQLTTQVTPGRVVASHLPPTVSLSFPHSISKWEDGRHFYSLTQACGAQGAGAEHCKDNVRLEDVKPTISQRPDALQRHLKHH